jgi:hypothetical protein
MGTLGVQVCYVSTPSCGLGTCLGEGCWYLFLRGFATGCGRHQDPKGLSKALWSISRRIWGVAGSQQWSMADAPRFAQVMPLALLLLLGVPPVVRTASGDIVTLTQAGCTCLPAWKDRQGREHNGCRKPDVEDAVSVSGEGGGLHERVGCVHAGCASGKTLACRRSPVSWSMSRAAGFPPAIERCCCPTVQGAWCAVDPGTCQGYYSFFTGSDGATVFYDYCDDVRGVRAWSLPPFWMECLKRMSISRACPTMHARKVGPGHATRPARPCPAHDPLSHAERTKSGCLCAAEWRAEGAGKAMYQNRCAHPSDFRGGCVRGAGSKGPHGGAREFARQSAAS